VPQHQDLQLLRPARTPRQQNEREQTPHRQVRKTTTANDPPSPDATKEPTVADPRPDEFLNPTGSGVSVLPRGKSWIDAYLEDRGRRDLSPSEIERYRGVLEEFREFVRPKWLGEISPEDWVRYMEEVAPHKVPEGRFRKRALGDFFSYLSLHGVIPWNP
jgi:hypothetical protein